MIVRTRPRLVAPRAISKAEAAHAVAAHFHLLAGRTESVTFAPTALAKFNRERSPAHRAAGLHVRRRTLPVVRARSVDREQLHALLLGILAGPAGCSWIYAGAGVKPLGSGARLSPRARSPPTAESPIPPMLSTY